MLATLHVCHGMATRAICAMVKLHGFLYIWSKIHGNPHMGVEFVKPYDKLITIPYSYSHLLVITGYFYGIIHSINVVISTYNWYFGP